jgi:hypothetical protein
MHKTKPLQLLPPLENPMAKKQKSKLVKQMEALRHPMVE